MKRLGINISYIACTPEELDGTDSKVVSAAKEATNSSYAPYSGFHVGAALLMSDGSIITGCNQENAAYPSGLCAERTALFRAGIEAPGKKPVSLAIAARSGNVFTDSPITPCGACRQVMAEVETRYGVPLKIILFGTDQVLVFTGIRSLLPFCFGAGNMASD